MVPGEYVLAAEPVTCNAGREAIELEVVNRGDRPVQVGSHFHFAEINPALDFDREQALGRRLDIPAGTAVRFEPGDKKTVQLILLAGKRQVYGFHNMINGPLDPTEPTPIHHMESPDYGFETTATDDEATEKES